ncbi:MAG: sigma-54-dependent Fis family transcriptional regulator [Anaerolineales bacterium]
MEVASDFSIANGQPVNSFHDQQSLQAAWQQFITTQKVDPCVPPIIAASWQRCWGKVNPTKKLEFTRMSSSYLLASQSASFDLIAIARPVLEDLYQCVQNSGTVLILTNNVGCILDLVGDSEMVEVMNRWAVGLGCLLSEELIGTTSFGLAMLERVPVQVAGCEHFSSQFHGVTGASAPIFDPIGHLLGTLGLVMPLEKYHMHSLGLVTAAARAIESQRQADVLLEEQNSQLAQLNAILSAISDGILVWSHDGNLIHANHAASQILGIPTQSMLGRNIDTVFSIPASVRKSVSSHKSLTDFEGIIGVDERVVNCLISIGYVFQAPNQARWTIMTLRPENKVRRLVQRQVGAQAPLTLSDIPGESLQIQRVRNFVKSAAAAQASILIRGEVGTGKNVLASAIHNAGPRSDGPFVVFACSSVPNELVISELLGYDESENKHASGRPSKFELAQGGTLFFQDVDALPIEAQSVLLNALELGVIQRLRGHRAIEINVRIIASTSANIENLIAQGAFRSDLYYRLGVFTITLPPLRERIQDLPLIVDRILTRFSQQLKQHVELDATVMDILKKYPWPGNIRELEAVLGRAATQIESIDGTIEPKHLPLHVRSPHRFEPGAILLPAFNSLEEMEYESILRAARSCRGNITRMSEALGIGRTTLWRKLKYFHVDIREYRQRPA